MLQRIRTRADMTFRETMAGPFAMGVTEPDEGARAGRNNDWRMALEVTVTIDDMTAFTAEPRPPARLDGELDVPGVRGRVPFQDGVFRLFPPSDGDGRTLMIYELGFEHEGTRYHLAGSKTAGVRPRLIRLWPDTTTLDVRLYRGTDVVGAGVLRLTLMQLVRLVVSVRTPHSGSPVETVRTVGGFAWLFVKNLAGAYLSRRS
jgi:hypothetical protein